ncbi:MAG: hypothetical protein ACYDBH_21285 [Acidobacteriaceae bacterium]
MNRYNLRRTGFICQLVAESDGDWCRYEDVIREYERFTGFTQKTPFLNVHELSGSDCILLDAAVKAKAYFGVVRRIDKIHQGYGEANKLSLVAIGVNKDIWKYANNHFERAIYYDQQFLSRWILSTDIP